MTLLAAILLLGALAAAAGAGASSVVAAAPSEPRQTPDWLEPRGLNVVELVGQIPDEYLHDTIVSYNDWHGIVVYDSGKRIGDTVVVTTTIYPRFNQVAWAPNRELTLFGCLGQAPHYDHMGSAVPPSILRVYNSEGREVTQEVVLLTITEMGLRQPDANSTSPFRYPEIEYEPGTPNPIPLEPDGLHLPANTGCWIRIAGANYYPLTGVFTTTLQPSVFQANVLGTQAASFKSYIGPGWVGIFDPLMTQLHQTYGNRHDRIALNIPAGANYFLLKFPPMPADPYTDVGNGSGYLNADRPSGGTYRLSDGTPALSTDMVFSAGFPLAPAWKDTDQSSGSEYLPLIPQPSELAPPEYVIPAGMPYDDCFTAGNCPGSVLERIYQTEMSLEIVYLQVAAPMMDGAWIPLRMAGPAWLPGGGASGAPYLSGAQSLPRHTPSATDTHYIFLPIVARPAPAQGCPCGWFDAVGRMLDVYPSNRTTGP